MMRFTPPTREYATFFMFSNLGLFPLMLYDLRGIALTGFGRVHGKIATLQDDDVTAAARYIYHQSQG